MCIRLKLLKAYSSGFEVERNSRGFTCKFGVQCAAVIRAYNILRLHCITSYSLRSIRPCSPLDPEPQISHTHTTLNPKP